MQIDWFKCLKAFQFSYLNLETCCSYTNTWSRERYKQSLVKLDMKDTFHFISQNFHSQEGGVEITFNIYLELWKLNFSLFPFTWMLDKNTNPYNLVGISVHSQTMQPNTHNIIQCAK